MPYCGDPDCDHCGSRCDDCDELIGYHGPYEVEPDHYVCYNCVDDYPEVEPSEVWKGGY